MTDGEFTLYERKACSTAQWRSLKLVSRTAAKESGKRNWWLGWNGARLARNTGTKERAKHHPGIRRWVIDSLRERHEGRTISNGEERADGCCDNH